MAGSRRQGYPRTSITLKRTVSALLANRQDTLHPAVIRNCIKTGIIVVDAILENTVVGGLKLAGRPEPVEGSPDHFALHGAVHHCDNTGRAVNKELPTIPV